MLRLVPPPTEEEVVYALAQVKRRVLQGLVCQETAEASQQLSEFIVAGKARVGIKIPEDYARRLEMRPQQTAQVLIVIDGSESERDDPGRAVSFVPTISRHESPPLLDDVSSGAGVLGHED